MRFSVEFFRVLLQKYLFQRPRLAVVQIRVRIINTFQMRRLQFYARRRSPDPGLVFLLRL